MTLQATSSDAPDRTSPLAGTNGTWRTDLVPLADALGDAAALDDAVRTPFQRADWLSAFTSAETVVVRAARGDGAVAIFPFQRRRLRWGRALEWLGQEWSDYNAPVLNAAAARLDHGAARALLGAALKRAAHALPFDVATLRKEPQWLSSPAGSVPNPFGRRSGLESDGGHSLTMPSDPHALKAMAGNAKSRSKMRRKLERIAETGPVRIDLDVPSPARSALLRTMLAWKSDQLDATGANNPFRGGAGLDVLEASLAEPGRDGGRLAALYRGEAPIAAIHLLIDRGHWLLYQASYAADGPTEHSPGRLLLDAVLRAAIAEGAARFDFGGGDEAYKRPLSERRDALGYTLLARTPRGRAVLPVLATHLRLRAWGKASPERMAFLLRAKKALGR